MRDEMRRTRLSNIIYINQLFINHISRGLISSSLFLNIVSKCFAEHAAQKVVHGRIEVVPLVLTLGRAAKTGL